MDHIEQYMASNKFTLNSEKSIIIILSKDKDMKKYFSVEIKGKTI